jgi:hypothetical protein
MFKRNKPAGEPTPASGRIRPDDAVLDELSRAFDVSVDVDDNAALIDDNDDDTVSSDAVLSSPVTPASEVKSSLSAAPGLDISTDATAEAAVDPLDAAIELSIVTSDGPRPAADAAPRTPPSERRTIKIGDGFDGAGLNSLSVDEARGRQVNLDVDPSGSSMSALTATPPSVRALSSRSGAASSDRDG